MINGKPYDAWAIGGILFTLKIKKKIMLTGIAVIMRELGNHEVEIYSK